MGNQASQINAKSVYSCCPETPVLGGANQAASIYCKSHLYLADVDSEPDTKRQRIVITVNLRDQRLKTDILPLTDDLPDVDDRSVHTGCKKPENVPRFHNRSAGLMAVVRPCGMILGIQEMLTCESPSQLFVLLLRLESEAAIHYIGYDRACEFAPFLKNLAKKGNEGAKQLLACKYLVDRLHIRGHTTPGCNINDPACLYHPSLDKFSAIAGVNTECAEQCFSWLGRFRNSVKYMSHYKFKVFLHFVISARNKYMSQKRISCAKK